MGYSSYLEVWPASLAEKLQHDEGCWRAFCCMWGNGSGMHAWLDQFDECLIEEICEGVASTAVDRLRSLLADAERFPTAFLAKTHDIHETILSRAFGLQGAKDASELAKVVIFGADPLGASTGFWLVNSALTKELAAAMLKIPVSTAVGAFDIGDRSPEHAWRESLRRELQSLVDVYRAAAQHGHQVITGVPWGA